jgi:hypothetical protein
MAPISSRKQAKSAKSSSREKSGTGSVSVPLVIDLATWSILDAELANAPGAEQLDTDPPDKDLSIHPLSPGLARSVFEKTLESLKEVQQQHVGELSARQFIRQVAETLADKADAGIRDVPVVEGWQQLLERGLKSKTALLKSTEFKSTSQASDLLGIGEHAVRKRVKEQRLFALRTPGDGEHRIPAWALDPKITGATTAALLARARSADEWRIYHFMSTPNGSLNGLRPFECLLSNENLPRAKLVAKDEFIAHLKLSAGSSLLEPVRQALERDLTEGQET